jgi:hypothetical protein
MKTPREFLAAYHEARRPLSCEIDVQPWNCEFWPYGELDELNAGYKVSTYAPGYFAFASSGGGEMYAFGPSGEIVCLAFVGMSTEEAVAIAKDWPSFESMLKPIPLTFVGADRDR